MNISGILYILIVLTVDRSVLGSKKQYISECNHYASRSCYSTANGNLILQCAEKRPEVELFKRKLGYYGICSGNSFDDWKCIQKISFENCDQPIIESDIIKILFNIEVFDLSNTGLESLPLKNLSTSESLRKFNASNNRITEIPLDLSEKFENLNDLDLSFNNISEIPINIFQRLTALKRLLLAHNRIEKIPSFLFLKNENLIEIDLSYNEIGLGVINDFAFAGDFNLEKLNLSCNQLTYFHQRFHLNLTNLDLSNNRIVDLKSVTLINIYNLTHLDLSSNQITVLEAKFFENIRSLVIFSISNNSISNLNADTFGYLVKLELLDLSLNKIAEIKPGTFSNQRNLQFLNLAGNLLKSLNANMFSPSPVLPQLKRLSLENNQLNEINGFTSSFIPNAKIIGIDSNKFNCSYLHKLFKLITWKHLDSISTQIECNTKHDEIDLETTTIKGGVDFLMENGTNSFGTITSKTLATTAMVENGTMSQYSEINPKVSQNIETTLTNEPTDQTGESVKSTRGKMTTADNILELSELIPTFEKTTKIQTQTGKAEKFELNQQKLSEAEHQLHLHNNLIKVHNKLDLIEKYSYLNVFIMVIGFGIVALSFAWIAFHTQWFKKFKTANVFYRKSESDLSNVVENNQYEYIEKK